MRRVALTCIAALVVAGSAGAIIGVPPGPNATNECAHLAFCYGVDAPWVIVPAHGEASFLFDCPERSKTLGPFLLGGTDARVSSKHVHPWYEGKLGGPIAAQTTGVASTGLLFHASTDNGKPGSFQPVIGCISLKQASKRSTLSVRQSPPIGHATSSPPQPVFRARNLVLAPGGQRVLTVSCRASETLVGSWSAVAFGTAAPPIAFRPGTVSTASSTRGRTASVDIHTSTSVPYLIRVQVGAMCEP